MENFNVPGKPARSAGLNELDGQGRLSKPNGPDSPDGPLQFFPLERPREKQVKALDFIGRAVKLGYRHIAINAPTGIGKTAIGASACFWGDAGYYLVTQKLLQDQLERDFPNYRPGFNRGASLKSASEYACPQCVTCAVGLSKQNKRGCRLGESCTYRRAKKAFIGAALAITNYPYFLTERTHSAQLQARQILVADEAHTLERQLLRFVDLTVSESDVEQHAPFLEIPKLGALDEFLSWLEKAYLPAIKSRAEELVNLSGRNDKLAVEAARLEQYLTKTYHALSVINQDKSGWVYWSELNPSGKKEFIARPLNAAPFMPLVSDMGRVVIYMSAFLGEKKTFCRSLGLDPSNVAWCSLGSTFPEANRPIIIGAVGSMSRRNLEATLPRFLSTLEKIFEKHKNQKGLIHCNSYALGNIIFAHMSKTAHARRIIYPKKSDEREACFKSHCELSEPTVLLTPSMTEGFDFAGDLARWQVICKVPYPSLSDLQVASKKAIDPNWYLLEAVKTIIQASGRIVRSDTDTGYTYILDSDFLNLYERCGDYFPRWFTKAFVYPCPG